MIAIQHGLCLSPKMGEVECGDGYIIKKEDHRFIIGVMDGLGHGSPAAYASACACQILNEENNRSLTELFMICHNQLKSTRGIVLTLASINETTLTWLGVGNITGLLWGGESRHLLLTNGGIVGGKLPKLTECSLAMQAGDTLLLTTDGINSDFLTLEPMRDIQPKTIADLIFNQYRNPNDDALVLVVRILLEGRHYV